MKRKRGSKKGRPKKPKLVSTNEVASNIISLNTEDNSGLDEFDNEDIDSGMDAETETTPSPQGTTQPEPLAAAETVGRPSSNIFGKAVYTRVKVKIKTSINLELQRTSPDVPTQSDTDKSNQKVGSEKQGGHNEKMEDSANSLSETSGGNTSQKSIGIKIKSSKGLGSSSMSPCSNTEPAKGGRVEKEDTQPLHQESRYNEQELRTALEVIKKVMKMDAAEPFNVPVNPVALGIPDYFDVIDTPMDFGTICSNLEKGLKYKNSEDVYKDVEYIWNNCYNYNNKGDYIVELMKRVKKTFTKYWIAAGLYSDQPQESNGPETNPVKDLTPSSEGNTPADGGAALSLLSKKFHGLKKHKEGCQCAICVMMRRRQEREEIARMMGGHPDISDDSLGEDIKPEGISHGGSPFAEYASSNVENSPEADADMERKGQDMKLGHVRDFYGQQNEDDIRVAGKWEGSQDLQSSHRSGDEDGVDYHAQHIGSGVSISNETRRELPKQNDNANAAIDQQRPKELLDKNQRANMLANLGYLENPMLFTLYGTLFTDNKQSLWNGPHSVVGQTKSSNRRNSFDSAISSFMNS